MGEDRKKEVAQKIGKRIYELRKEHKLTREKFAELCDISAQHVYYLENGDTLPGCLTLIEICNQFHISPSKILLDSVETQGHIFDETLLSDFNKLSAHDKNFVIQMVDSMIHLLLEKNA